MVAAFNMRRENASLCTITNTCLIQVLNSLRRAQAFFPCNAGAHIDV